MGVIYKITSPTGRLYIGQTTNYKKRLGDYKRCCRYTYDSLIINSIKKYGINSHEFSILEEVEDSLLSEREIFWIKQLRTYWKDGCRGMNMTTGGEVGSGKWIHDLKRREKQSKAFTKEGNPFYGRSHTDEFKAKKSKEVSEYNKKNGIKVPKWGADKGRLKVIRAIVCYDKYGNFLKEYTSLAEAAKLLNINHSSISESCNLIITGVKGKYIFRYKMPNYPLVIEVGEIKSKTEKKVVLYLAKNGKIIKEYPSALEASIDLKIPKTSINRAACYNNLRPLRSGHIFIYKDLYEQKVKKIS